MKPPHSESALGGAEHRRGSGADVWPEVRSKFPAFSRAREGRLNFMYLDTKSIVTFGVGNALFSWQDACKWPWKRPDGALASRDEVKAAWENVKAMDGGMVAAKYAPATTVRLDSAVLDQVFWSTFDANVRGLCKRYPGFLDWCAPAQFALLSWAWGGGYDRKDYPKMDAAIARRDWETAANEIAFDEKKTQGVKERNATNKALLQEAAMIERTGADPSVIRFRLV